jgi:uncharacterized protein YhbP (UPF0306 family)
MGVVIVRRELTDPRVRASLRRLLRENALATFATVGARARAYINTAYFAWSDDWTFYFYSYPDSRHCRNLELRPSMAVAVFDSHQRWGYPDRGAQLFGTAGEASGESAGVAATVYARRFPGYGRWRARVEREDGTFRLRPYWFRPLTAKLFDERSLGGGRFVEVTFPASLRGRRTRV